MCITEKGKKYMSLMEELKSKILSGEIRPGAKLPSENELEAYFLNLTGGASHA